MSLVTCDQTEGWGELMYDFHGYPGTPILLISFLASFVLSFAVGANDSANSWGTSVGAGTLSLGWAYVLGGLCETVGAVFLSGNVIKKLVNGIIDIDVYSVQNCTEEVEKFQAREMYLEGEQLLLFGCLSVMVGSALWQLIASSIGWPVSGSHSIVSSLLGFTLAAKGSVGVKDWMAMRDIAIGWVASPLASAALTFIIYLPLYSFCIRSRNPCSLFNRVIYSFLVLLAVGFNLVTIFTCGDLITDLTNWEGEVIQESTKDEIQFGEFLEKFAWSGIAFGIGAIISLLYFFFAIPKLVKMSGDFALTCTLFRRNAFSKQRDDVKCSTVPTYKKSVDENSETETVNDCRVQNEIVLSQEVVSSNSALVFVDDNGDDTPEIMRVFRPLQVLSACTGALAHGGNDVGNCIGPLVLIYHVFSTGVIDKENTTAPELLAVYGGLGIAMGLAFFGKRVIRTMGTEISRMTPSRGFCVEWMAAVTVLVCNMQFLGIPVSTTHCQVGALIGAGIARGIVEKGPRGAFAFVNFKLFGGIAASWVATIPFTMLFTCVVFWGTKAALW